MDITTIKINKTMKKIILILFLVLPIALYGQRRAFIQAAGSLDTTIFLSAQNTKLVTIDFTSLNGTSDTIDIGTSYDVLGFVSISDVFPLVVDNTSDFKIVNGVSRSRKAVAALGGWPGTYIAIRFKVVDSTSGTLIINY